jgi:hypothetical protein
VHERPSRLRRSRGVASLHCSLAQWISDWAIGALRGGTVEALGSCGTDLTLATTLHHSRPVDTQPRWNAAR